jgi:hypothetical protein
LLIFFHEHTTSGNSGTYLAEPALTESGEIKLPSRASSTRGFGEVVRMRRWALDFLGGERSMPLAELSAILAVTAQPLSADFAGTRSFRCICMLTVWMAYNSASTGSGRSVPNWNR